MVNSPVLLPAGIRRHSYGAAFAAVTNVVLPASRTLTNTVPLSSGMVPSAPGNRPVSVAVNCNVKSNEVIKFLVLNLGELDHEFMFGNQEIVAAHAELMKSHPNVPHDDPFMIHLESNEVGYLVWEFSSPGSFPFVCLIPGHYEAGMRGVLKVGS